MGGDIVYISSKNSLFAGPNNVAYGAAKADQAHQVRLLAAELGEHGIRVNGINPDGVVRGSGIFAGGWGAKRAAVYGVPEERARRVLRPAHAAQARGAARARGQRRVRADRRRAVAHDRPAHPGRRRRRRGVPAMTSLRRSPRSTSARPAGGSCSAGSAPGGCELTEVAPVPERAGARSAARCTGTSSRCTAASSTACARAGRGRTARRRHRLLGRRLRPARRRPARCSATRCTTATPAPTACWTGSLADVAGGRALRARPACSCCRSTRSTSSSPRPARPARGGPARCC